MQFLDQGTSRNKQNKISPNKKPTLIPLLGTKNNQKKEINFMFDHKISAMSQLEDAVAPT